MLFYFGDDQFFPGLGVQSHVNKAVNDWEIFMNSKFGAFIEHMSEYFVSSESASTKKAYKHGFQRRKTFINDHEHSEIPAHPTHVALYITYLLISWASHSTVNTANNSITWVHEISNFPNHTEITSDHQTL